MTQKNIIVDLDGTLALDSHRRHHITKDGWDTYFAKCHLDPVNEIVKEFMRVMWAYHNKIIILTGRSDGVAVETVEWLRANGVCYDEIHMRPKEHYQHTEGTAQPIMSHVDLKLAQAEELGINPGNTLCVLEDMDDLVEGWRNAGFHCWQVMPQGYKY